VGQGEPPGAPPSRRPEPTRHRLLPAVPTPCIMSPTTQPLAPEGRRRRTDLCVWPSWGWPPRAPGLHHRATGASRPLLFLILQGLLPLEPCHHPGPGSTVPRPGATTTSLVNCRPSAPTLMTLTGAACWGTGPGAGPGAWSGDRAAPPPPDPPDCPSLTSGMPVSPLTSTVFSWVGAAFLVWRLPGHSRDPICPETMKYLGSEG
jgi:hypothetical protein